MLRQVGTQNFKKKKKKEKKNPVYKNQGWEPIHQKYKEKKENTKRKIVMQVVSRNDETNA
jgi:hypothetical protein